MNSKLQNMLETIYSPGYIQNFFETHPTLIGEFITKMGLTAWKVQAAPAAPAKTHISSEQGMKELSIRGGWVGPHLHYEGKIFPMNDKQWSEFSATIINECKVQLSNVKEITFEHAIALSDTVTALTAKK